MSTPSPAIEPGFVIPGAGERVRLIPTQRGRLLAELERLTRLRDDVEPDSAAYQRLSDERDDVCEQIWWLGPVEV